MFKSTDSNFQTSQQSVLNKHEQALILTITPSKVLIHVLCLVHLLALAACIICILPTGLKIALFIACSMNFGFFVKYLKNKQYILKHSYSSGWEISEGDRVVSIQIENSTVVTLVAVFLHFRQPNKAKETIVILPDSLTEDDFRRLIVKLKTSL